MFAVTDTVKLFAKVEGVPNQFFSKVKKKTSTTKVGERRPWWRWKWTGGLRRRTTGGPRVSVSGGGKGSTVFLRISKEADNIAKEDHVKKSHVTMLF